MKYENMNLPDYEEIECVIAHYLEGNATAHEKLFLENWINTSKANSIYYNQLKNLWEIAGTKHGLPKISTEEALNKVIKRISANLNSSIWRNWKKVAAILFIPLLIGGYWLGRKHAESASLIIHNEVFAAYGTRSAMELSDGSKVWLNSGSSLSYPDKFTFYNRIVKLKGEAYFEVKSDPDHPFIVQTESISVKATGTKFNIEAYPGIPRIEVSLLTGRVSVNKSREPSSKSIIAELQPNQHLVYETISGKTNLKSEDVYKYVSWKDGKLIFRNEPLKDVVAKIGQIYNVDIELQGDNIQNYPYRATFQEESLAEILKLLKLSSPIDYKELNRRLLPDGSFAKKKILVFPRNKKIVH